MEFLCVALGGAAGAIARFGLGGWVHARRPHFPWATLAINVSGAFLLGFSLPYLPPHSLPRALLATGFLGAYTTFSTFGLETALLIQDRRQREAGAYVLATLLVGIAAAWLGAWTAGLAGPGSVPGLHAP